MTEEIQNIKEKFKKKLESYELDKKFGQLSVDSIGHLFPTEMELLLNYIEELENRINKSNEIVKVLLEDLKKDIKHKEETGQHWFNEELLCVRLNEILKNMDGKDNG